MARRLPSAPPGARLLPSVAPAGPNGCSGQCLIGVLHELAQIVPFFSKRHHGAYPLLLQRLPARALAPGQEEGRYSGRLGPSRHLSWGLPIRGLRVDPALARDHKIRTFELAVES